jgi:hypothetical protein
MSHDDKGPVLELPPELVALIREAEAVVPPETRCCTGHTLEAIVRLGLAAAAKPRDLELDRPTGELTVRELARLLGAEDLEAARQLARDHREKQEELQRESTAMLGGVRGLRFAQLVRYRTRAELEEQAVPTLRRMIDGAGPTQALVLIVGLVDEATAPSLGAEPVAARPDKGAN